MFCSNCGNELPEKHAKFCSRCGSRLPTPPSGPPPKGDTGTPTAEDTHSSGHDAQPTKESPAGSRYATSEPPYPPAEEQSLPRPDLEDYVMVNFHVIVAKNFVNTKKDKIIVKAGGIEGFIDWIDTVCEMNYSKKIDDSSFLYEGTACIPATCVDTYIPYKYVAVSDRGEEEYEDIEISDSKKNQPPANRCLHMRSQYLTEEWHQYDDVCMKWEGTKILKFWQDKRKEIHEDKKKACRVMLGLIFSHLRSFEDQNLKDFFVRLEHFCAVHDNPRLLVGGRREKPTNHVDVKEIHGMILEEMCEKIFAGQAGTIMGGWKRLAAGLLFLRVTHQHSITISRQHCEALCHALCLEKPADKMADRTAADLQAVQRTFSAYDRMDAALIELCQTCIREDADWWVWVLPVLHTFSFTQESSWPARETTWSGLEWIQRNALQRKDSALLMKMKEKRHLLRTHRMVPRSWLCLTPTDHLMTFLELPVKIVDALRACCFKFSRVDPNQIQTVTGILRRLLLMMEQQSRSLDGTLFEEYSGASLGLHMSISQNALLKKTPEIIFLSAKIVLTVLHVAEQLFQGKEHAAARQSRLAEIRNVLHKVRASVLEWLEDVYKHNLNYKLRKAAFGEELQAWDRIIQIGEEWPLDWRDPFLHTLHRKIQREEPLVQITMYCEQYHFLGTLRACIGERFEDCAMAAVPSACKTQNNILSLISSYNLQNFGKLVSHVIEHSWPKDRHGKHVTLIRDVVKHLLEWPDTQHILRLHGSKVQSEFTEGVRRLVDLLVTIILEIPTNVIRGTIPYNDMEIILQKEKQFLALCDLQTEGREMVPMDTVLRWRREELGTFRTEREWVGSLIKMVLDFHHTLKVNISDIQEKHQEDLGPKILSDIFPVRMPESPPGGFGSAMSYYKLDSRSLDMAKYLHTLINSHVFRTCWLEKAESLQQSPATEQSPEAVDFTIRDVYDSVYTPCFEQCTAIYTDLRSGQSTFAIVDKFFYVFKDKHEQLTNELRALCCLDNNHDYTWIPERVQQIEQYHQLHVVFCTTRLLYDLKTHLHLSGDFNNLETLLNFADNFENYKQKTLSYITDELLQTKNILLEIRDSQCKCLEEVLRCKDFLGWVRETLKDLNELKVFVDLASISAGENDMEVDRVAFFHDAVLGFSPLLYEVKSYFGFDSLMECLQKLWKALENDPHLPKKLGDSARHIEWLKTVKESHGSVELSSLSLATTINKSGIYTIRAPRDSTKVTLDSVLQLSVQENGALAERLYTLEEVKELLNKLMLLSWKGDQRNAEVDKFSEVISNVQRLAGSFIDLYVAGNMLFRTMVATIYCSEEAEVSILMKFDVDIIDELKGHGDLSDLLPDICRTMEKCLDQWLTFISHKRSQHYYLNYYTGEQVVYLCQACQRGGISEEALQLLSFINPNCAKNEASQLLSPSDVTPGEKSHMMEFDFDFKELETVSEKVEHVWKLSMTCISSLFPGCLDMDTLGVRLAALAEINTESVVRDLHPNLRSDRPNLLLCDLSVMLACTTAIYMHSPGQPLPSYDEVLLCSPQTSFEEVALFLHRCLIPGYQGRKIYTLVYADRLSYEVAYKSEQLFQQLQARGMNNYHLVIICSSDQEHHYIPSAFSQYVIHMKLQKPPAEIQHYLCGHFRVGSDVVSAARVFKNGLSAGIVTSKRAGVGKSLYVKRLYQKLVSTFPNQQPSLKTIRLTKSEVDEDKILETLLPLLEKTKTRPVIFHIDITSSVKRGISEFLFKLLVLRYLTDSEGRMWKYQPSHLYIIEMLDCSAIRSVHQSSINDFFPKISCCPPKEIMERAAPPDCDNPGMDMEEFSGECFQRPYQFLTRFHLGQNLDTFAYSEGHTEDDPAKCLQTFLRYCGIGDPSWSELRNFAWFLNLQLKDCEASVFCNAAFVKDALQGFKKFVVTFMMLMAKDFATPSLLITDQSPESQDNVGEQNLLPFMMRKRWETEPHPYIFFNDDHMCMTFIGFFLKPNNAGGVDAINPVNKSIIQENIMSSQLYASLKLQGVPFDEDFDQLSRGDKIKKLCMVLGIKEAVDPDETYELTMDNVLKILAIKMRFRCGIPVVIMGETGCGKTRLIKFLCQLCRRSAETENMMLVKVHGGTTTENICRKILDAQKIARKNMEQGGETVLFFDEANTTEAITSIKEAMCDHSIEGVPLEKESGLQIIAACNPYRMHTDNMIKRLESAGLGYRVGAGETKERLGSIPLRQLVYRVHALPPSMMPLVWDFGQLKKEAEEKYIQQIVRHLVKDIELSSNDIVLLSSVLSASQSYMRMKRDECSFVSLRDVERCIEVFKWFHSRYDKLLDHQQSMLGRNLNRYKDEDKSAWCLVHAIGVCYHASLEIKGSYRKEICKLFPRPYNDPDAILNEITHMQDVFLAGVRLGDTIAENLALKENLFMMVICIELKIPLFLIGKPGSSKSLAKTIVADAMQGQTAHTALYRDLKQIHLVSFQCSPHSSPEGIIGTFKHCARFQEGKNLNEYVSVVVLDEIGLAEDSPKMPLKTLHPLLEDGCLDDSTSPHKRVGFIGISNWALDPAKMNRGIFVSRGDPSREDLIKTAEGICSSDTLTRAKVSRYFSDFAEAYLKVCETQRGQEKEFFGLRDFYCLIKMVFGFTKKSKVGLSLDQIARAVLRNFSGKDQINPVSIFLPQEKPRVAGIHTMDLVMENINSDSDDCRYLLLLTKNYAALQILQQALLRADKQPEIIFGSSFLKDQDYTQICRNINRVKICMETGQMVILLNLQNLYESLYDALNQYYVFLAGQKYVDLGLGTHRVKCRVHPKFRLIVIEEKDVVYKEFPVPLINRLEKHYLDINTFLKKEHKAVVRFLEAWVKDFAKAKQRLPYSPSDVFIGYHSDTCASVVLQVMDKVKPTLPDAETTEDAKSQAIHILLNCATPDSVIRYDDAEYLHNYFKEQNHVSLIDLLRCHVTSARDTRTTFTEVTTFSRLLTSADRNDLEAELGGHASHIGILSLQQFDTEVSFLNKVRTLLEGSSGNVILIIQTDFKEGSQGPNLVASAKFSVVNEVNKVTLPDASVFVYFITKLPRMRGGTSYVGFRGGLWSSIHVDDLRQLTGMAADITVFQGVPISRLFFTTEKTDGDKDMEMEDDDAIERENQEMDGNNSQPRPEKLLNTSALIRSCIQRAVGLLQDDGLEASRSTKRINIFLNLLSGDDNLSCSFVQTMKLRLYKMLEMWEMTAHEPSKWVKHVANNADALQEAGTFRQAMWNRLQRAVTPLLSHMLSVMDCNANLDVFLHEKDHFVRSLWLHIFQDDGLLPIPYNSSENMQIIPVKHSMNISLFRQNQLPFSWRIRDELEEIWTQAQNMDSRAGPAMKVLGIFTKTRLGDHLSRQEARKQQSIFRRYMRDFILMTMSISSDKELQVMESAFTAVIEELRASKEAEEPLQLPWVHIGYNKFQHKLQNLRRILAIAPSVLESLILNIRDPKRSHSRGMALDIRAAVTSLELLQESLRTSDPRDWMQQVKNLQVPIKVIGSGDNVQSNKAAIRHIRSLWNCVYCVALFLQHLLVEENLRNEYVCGLVIRHAHRMLMSPDNFADMKSEKSFMSVVNFLRLFRDDLAASELSDSKQKDIRKQCYGFFVDITCHQCFKGNTPPDAGVIRHLLSHIFSSTESGESTQPLSIFKDAVDKTRVDSVILKLLLKYSFDHIMKHVQEYLDKVKTSNLLRPEDTTELYLLFINCIEDSLLEKRQKNQSEAKKDIKRYSSDVVFLQTYLTRTKKDVRNEQSVEFLQDVARVRLALNIAAEMLCEKPPETRNEDLLRSVQELCSQSGNDWYRIYLIRKLAHLVGIDALQRHLKDPETKWIFTWDAAESHIDHFLVYGHSYKTLRDGVARAMTRCDPQPIADAVKEYQPQGEELTTALILSVYREITLYYGAQQGTAAEQASIKSFIQNERTLGEQSQKQFVETLLSNSRPFLRAVPSMTASQVTTGGLLAHLAAVLLSGNHSLLLPLRNLSFSAAKMQNSFLPTMPEDMLSHVRGALRTRERLHWYACPNGHPYSIGECGKAYTVSKCVECNAVIGGAGHKLQQGNLDYDKREDTTERGHVLGAPERQSLPSAIAADRGIAVPTFILLRMITHLAMLLGSEQDEQSLQLMVRPQVPEVRHFLSRHVEKDLEYLRASLGKGTDETTSAVHLILHQMCRLMRSAPGKYSDAVWSTREVRNDWEREFAAGVIDPVLKDLHKLLGTVKTHISQDEEIVSNPVVKVVYGDPSESVLQLDLPQGSLVHCSKVWACREQVSIEYLRHLVQQQQGKVNLPLLWEFLEKESELKMVKFLPGILKLQKDLLKKIQNIKDTHPKTIIDFLRSIRPVGVQRIMEQQIEEFLLTWNHMKTFLKNGEIQLPENMCDGILSLDSDLEFLLPRRKGRGLAATALTSYLIALHNRFANMLESSAEPRHKYTVTSSDVTDLHVISYELEKDVLPIILSNCHYSLETGKETSREFNFPEIQRQVVTRLFQGKPVITLEGLPTLVLSHDRDYGSLITDVRNRIHQVSLPNIDDIRRDLSELSSVCSAYDLVDLSLGFLAMSGGDPEVSLSNYLEDNLQMGDQSNRHVLEALSRCDLQHVVAIWQLLAAMKSQHRLHLREDPFAEVDDSYKAALDGGGERGLAVFLERYGNNIFLLELYEMIVLNTKRPETFQPRWSLRDTMVAFLEAKDVSFPGMAENFPENIRLEHCVEVWKRAATRRWGV